ncbi:uncharacterized protein LOC143486137 isoform X2 [Brachyhypopomus gauderio]|uniref:uncharacterized protein LOC143486137 isoform X2 n=1 Tax=Brachyhypopomus gauderio TaxID=698409 RepID=UPI0040418A36
MCDAPARAFIKGIKSHTGYAGCDKCVQSGVYMNHRMTFPETHAACRTDESFRVNADEDHHLHQSPLLETDIGMVSCFPHDYMHLVCLGVVRKCLDLWMGSTGPLRCRLSTRESDAVSERLMALRSFVPVEFARKPRRLSERLRWKATELRQFLLYTGPVVLRDLRYARLEEDVHVTKYFRMPLEVQVSFVDTQEVEVVAALWVKDGVCLWPPYKSEGVQRAIKMQEHPGDNWTPYKIKVLYTANNYNEARRKLPLAEQQTDLQSEAEDESLKPPKRKIKPNKRLLEDGYNTDEEALVPKKNFLPQAPRIKQPFKKTTVSHPRELHPQPGPQRQSSGTSSLLHQMSSAQSLCCATSTSATSFLSAASQLGQENSSERHREVSLGASLREAIDISGHSETPGLTCDQLWHQDPYEEQSHIQSHQINLWHQEPPIQSQHQAAQPVWQQEPPIQSQHQAPQSVWQQEATPRSAKETLKLQRLRSASICEQNCATLLHDLLTKQEIIIEQQRNLIRMVQNLKTTSTRENAVDCGLDQRHLPVEDLSSLMDLENDLKSSPDKRKKLVLELGLIGGADIKDTVWRILKQAIKNNLAKTVNWRGVNGKTGFQSLELKSVVIEAVRRNPLCANATDIEVEKVIRRWFHLAGDREGGRKRRKQIAEDMESNTSGKSM